MIVSKILNYLEDVNINTFLREIDEHFQCLISEYGEDADTRLLSQIQRLQNLAELLNHKRLNYLSAHYQNTDFIEEKSQVVTNPQRNNLIPKKGQQNNTINEMIENYRKAKVQSTTTENNKEQESGDIHFAATILPYTPKYIRDLCRKGIIPHSQPNGKYVFFRKDLEEWLQKNSSEKDLSRLEIGKMGHK